MECGVGAGTGMVLSRRVFLPETRERERGGDMGRGMGVWCLALGPRGAPQLSSTSRPTTKDKNTRIVESGLKKRVRGYDSVVG